MRWLCKPPYTERYVRWCEGTVDKLIIYLLLDYECWRVLRNGGLFTCSTPNKRVSFPYTKKPSNPFHIKEFHIDEFSNLLDKYFVGNRLYGQNNISLIKNRIEYSDL